jgi:hypothetical protein
VKQARQPAQEPSQQIRSLYQAHAVGLVRLAFLMTGDQPTNEGGKQAAQLGVISNGHIRLLKISKSLPQTAYATVAF